MSSGKKPLCIDLDGTLIGTDLLHESAVSAVKMRPWLLPLLPLWILRGKAFVKEAIASRSRVTCQTLPYRREVLDLAEAARRDEREVVLCTAADASLAAQVAAHLGLFDTVIASDGKHNMSGDRKAAELVDRYGSGNFDYVGNAAEDLPVWRHAATAIVVGASDTVLRQLRASHEQVVELESPRRRPFRSAVRVLRLHQWLKNLLVFVPVITAHRLFAWDSWSNAILAFLAFGLTASAVYVLNDLVDIDADRAHARKRFRPLASGELGVGRALLLSVSLLVVAGAICVLLPPAFAVTLACYFAATTAYSLYLKRIPVIDVLLLAGLYTTRIAAGGAAIGVGLSFWLIAFSVFLFFALALVKRFTEVSALKPEQRLESRGYRAEDQRWLSELGAGAGFASVLVLALYINAPTTAQLYGRPEALWILCALLLYWVSRIWMLAHRGEMPDDPVIFAARDSVSWVLLVVGVAVVAWAI